MFFKLSSGRTLPLLAHVGHIYLLRGSGTYGTVKQCEGQILKGCDGNENEAWRGEPLSVSHYTCLQ